MSLGAAATVSHRTSRSRWLKKAGEIAYLLERSLFYREKLGPRPSDRLEDIALLPLTEKSELRATVTPDNPFGSHLCADGSEIVRIYSTSGTTGSPS